ncbi:hypothetical protein EDC04DRAFT_2614852 [Pisolithus marmoratus]|nr:hypothetical protein EDC04DRAFT_2614852 [Pisolithus marmoratus]
MLPALSVFAFWLWGEQMQAKRQFCRGSVTLLDQPEIWNEQGQKVEAAVIQGSLTRGYHNIEDELVFVGSEEQFDSMKKFVMERAKTPKLDKRIHAICFLVTVIHGHVPVIVLLTKADTLNLEAVQEEVEGRLLKSALARVKGWLDKQTFPPHDYLALTGMQKEGAECASLLTCTAKALNEEGLQQLLISTQQSNLELCMEFAIMKDQDFEKLHGETG